MKVTFIGRRGRSGLPLPVACLILILAGSHPAAALPMFSVIQKQTTTFIIDGAFAQFGVEFPFNYFDASLGTLQSVDLDVTGSNGAPMSFYAAKLSVDKFCGPGTPQFPPCDGFAIQGMSPWMFVNGLAGVVGNEILFDAQCNDLGNGNCQGSDFHTGFFSLHTSAPNPAAFVNNGTFKVELTTLLGTSSLTLPISLHWAPDLWAGDLTVTYTYAPKSEVPTPEPGSAILMSAVCGVLALIQARRGRRTGSRRDRNPALVKWPRHAAPFRVSWPRHLFAPLR